MNYPLRDAIVACVRDKDAERLADTVERQCRNYPEHVLHSLMNGVGTHDTERILTAVSGAEKPADGKSMEHSRLDDEMRRVAKKRLKLASLLQFTLPGTPCVYYGDEAGMEGWTDPFNRRCYPWGSEDAELVAWYAALSRLRHEHECFKDGEYRLLLANAGVFAFVRGQGSGRVLIAVNCSDSGRDLKPGGFNYDLLKSEYTDSLTVKPGEPAIFAIREREPV
jgi:glycosidase